MCPAGETWRQFLAREGHRPNRELARQLGCTVTRIHGARHRNGFQSPSVGPGGSRRTPELPFELERMIRQGMSNLEIARALRYTVPRIDQLLRETGIDRRRWFPRDRAQEVLERHARDPRGSRAAAAAELGCTASGLVAIAAVHKLWSPCRILVAREKRETDERTPDPASLAQTGRRDPLGDGPGDDAQDPGEPGDRRGREVHPERRVADRPLTCESPRGDSPTLDSPRGD